VGLHLDAVVSDGRQPVGRGIGPVLEARDVLQVLNNDPAAPADLRLKALRLAGRVLEFDPDVRGGEGFALARDILDSGRALAKLDAIIDAQGRRAFDWRRPTLGALVHDVTARADGVVTSIDNQRLARIARLAGAPKGEGAGVDLYCKSGDAVSRGQALYRIYASNPSGLEFARHQAERDHGYAVGHLSTAAPDLPLEL
jgi:thymidine phosphorylase